MFILDDIARWLKGPQEGSGALEYPVLEALPLPLLVCDKGLSILRTNPAFTRLFKVDKDHLKGKTALQILGTDIKRIEERDGWPIKERQVSNLGDLVEGDNPKILKGNSPKIGPRVFLLHTRKVPPITLLVFEDITKQRKLDEMIRQSRRELLSVFDGIEDPMVIIDKNYRIQRINEAMLKAVGGRSYRRFIGKACYWALHGRRDICPGCTAGKTLRTGKKTARMGLLERRPEADQFTYQITCHPLKDKSGRVTAIAESYRDMTEVAQMEEELYQSERNRMVEALAAGVAHEVRNPLAIIRSTAQYCLGEVGKNRDLQESLETIVTSSETANRVVSSLLDFSRPVDTSLQRKGLRPLLEEAIRLVKGRADTQRVRIRKSIPANLPPLILNENRFIQALVNFFLNSLDAMPRGGILGVEARHNRHDRKLSLIIRDSGEGIPQEMVPKIFQPFYTTKKEGVGLGLPIAEGIIRSQGGRVRFRSWPGKGTEVRIELPIRQKPWGKK